MHYLELYPLQCKIYSEIFIDPKFGYYNVTSDHIYFMKNVSTDFVLLGCLMSLELPLYKRVQLIFNLNLVRDKIKYLNFLFTNFTIFVSLLIHI